MVYVNYVAGCASSCFLTRKCGEGQGTQLSARHRQQRAAGLREKECLPVEGLGVKGDAAVEFKIIS